MSYSETMTPADIAAVCGNNRSSNDDGMFGGNGAWWIIILLLFGWGRGGYGFGGGQGGIGENYVLATDFATIERKLDGVNNGLADGFYAMNTGMLNGFASVQQTLCQGFNGLQQTTMQGFNNLQQTTMSGFHGVDNAVCGLSRQISDCCCETRAAIADVKYANERNTCDIIRASQDNTRAILDYLTTEKISALQAENSGLKAQISNDRQSAYIVDALSPKCPTAAYVVQPPQQVTFPTNCCGTVNYAGYGNSGCGCN